MQKRCLSFLAFGGFLLILLVSLLSCKRLDINFHFGGDSNNVRKESAVHVNICVLGNSYSNDAFSYVPFILKEYGVTSCIHIYYRGSLSLHDLDEQWDDDSALGIADLDGKNHNRFHFSIDTRTQKKWQKETIMSASSIVAMNKWDIITLQQGGRRARHEDTYYPYLENVIEKIGSKCDYSYSLAWFMSYNAGADNANEESVATQQRITQSFPFEFVIPVATAVFSCQENKILSELGDSQYKRMYASDNVHLQEGLPCYIAALTVSQAILNALGIKKSVEGNLIRPTQEWITSIGGITPNGQSTGVTEENCILAQKAAIQANMYPFEIIPIQ